MKSITNTEKQLIRDENNYNWEKGKTINRIFQAFVLDSLNTIKQHRIYQAHGYATFSNTYRHTEIDLEFECLHIL